jgi:putative transcriptional regulator
MTGKEIKSLRFRLGLTQEKFAQKLGVTVSSVVRWENNKRSPSPLAEKALQDLMHRLLQ